MRHPHFSAKDFSALVRRNLLKHGIRIIGLTLIPGVGDMPFANGERGYALDDNGTHRIRTYAEVRALGGDPVSW